MPLAKFLSTENEESARLENSGSEKLDQDKWFRKLRNVVQEGQQCYLDSSEEEKKAVESFFRDRVRTEELKAWYGAPDSESLFQGTSVSSLTIPAKFNEPLRFSGPNELIERIADSYIELHDRNKHIARKVIVEDIETWINQGLYYGVVVASKVISQTFGLVVPEQDIIFRVENQLIDPHEILAYDEEVRKKYFAACKERISCFEGISLSRDEFEESLILADISKPALPELKNKLILGPIKCNEICAELAKQVNKRIREKSNHVIRPEGLMVTIYDSDTPYTYYRVENMLGNPKAPLFPGLVVLGCSGSIDAFRWLYAYRVSLIAQKIQKGSLYSGSVNEYIPFVFFGVLVPRDAEILLELKNLDLLRYRGNLSAEIEYMYQYKQALQNLAHSGGAVIDWTSRTR